jgi:hypothetical protein
MANGASGSLAFADRQFPTRVDRPQRFGTGAYNVLDPGESSLRLDTRLIAAGISTAEQFWGPADRYPFVLGNNAPGFPHVFLGSGMPWNILIGHLHARLVYGQLSQSKYASVGTDSTHRMMSGLVFAFTPRGLSGFELGASRFFHTPWPDSGAALWSDLRLPIEGFLKGTLSKTLTGGDDASNQLASVFARWVLPHSGFEFYGEFGRDDHNWDLRDLVLEPDHASTHMLGIRKVWMADAHSFLAFRAEAMSMRLNTLTRTRPIGGGYYLNGTITQGHTERGQLLGADITAGSGAGTTIAIDRYSETGRWTVAWSRTLIDGSAPVETPESQHELTVESVRFRGPVDVHVSLTAVYDLNRYFTHDAFNFNAIVGARWSWH